MSDVELLRHAAKAAGIECMWADEAKAMVLMSEPYGDGYWNALDRDGDALRLAVTLDLTVSVDNRLREVSAWRYDPDPIDATVEYNNDPYAATRRAIVRAAAEIGLNLKER